MLKQPPAESGIPALRERCLTTICDTRRSRDAATGTPLAALAKAQHELACAISALAHALPDDLTQCHRCELWWPRDDLMSFEDPVDHWDRLCPECQDDLTVGEMGEQA